MRAQPLEIRMAHLEGAYEQINHRLGSVEQRLGSLESRIDAGFSRVDARFTQIDGRLAQMDQRFIWVIGLIVVSILLPIVQRFIVR